MILHQSVGPNPRVVLFYLAHCGLDMRRKFVDIMSGDNRQPAYLARNPAGGTPLLELDDGSHIADSVAICEYLNELHPEAGLVGATPEARARTRAILRQIDHTVVVPLTTGFRGAEGLPMFKDRMLCSPEAAPGNKALAADGLNGVDALVGKSAYLAGNTLTLADIVLFCFVEFGAQVGQPSDPALTNLAAWHERVGALPAATASANPQIGIDAAG